MIDAAKDMVKLFVGRRLLRENRRALREGGFSTNDRLRPDLWGLSVGEDGVLHAAGVDLVQVAEDFGTPVHVVDVERLEANAERFLSAFSDGRARTRLGTSYKTNPVPFVLRRLHDWGTLAEVISPFELWLARELGMPGERIIYNGPGKTVESLEAAVDGGLWLINVDSLEELEALDRACAERGRRQKVGFRVTTGVGWQSQFGLPIANGSAFRAFGAAARSEHLDPVGIHLHLGTGLSSIDTYVQGISEVVDLARRVNRELGVRITVLDLGGGFGVPTTAHKTEWDHRLQHLGMPLRAAVPSETPTPEDYARRILPIVDAYFDEIGPEGAELIFEPGRAITASAQMLLLSVLRVKRSGRDSRDVILDGGRNVCVPLAWEAHEIHPVGKMLETRLVQQNLYGPLCHPHDIVALHKPMPELEPGDVVAVMDAGAYFIPSQSNFSQPRPGIVAVEDGRARRVRRAESFEDVVGLDSDDAFGARDRVPSEAIRPETLIGRAHD